MPTTPVAPTLTKVASVRFSDAEYARLQLAAEDRGISVSELVRRAALKRELPAPLPPRVDLEAVGQLRRIGVNLNQIVRVLAQWERLARDETKGSWRTASLHLRELRETVAALAAKIAEPR